MLSTSARQPSYILFGLQRPGLAFLDIVFLLQMGQPPGGWQGEEVPETQFSHSKWSKKGGISN